MLTVRRIIDALLGVRTPFNDAAQKPRLDIEAFPHKDQSPPYRPEEFSAGENCYAYALNRKGENGSFNPGCIALREAKEYIHFTRLFKYETDRLNNKGYADYVGAATSHFQSEAERDGLIPVREHADKTRASGYLVALVMKDHSLNPQTSKNERDVDYHWLRQNPDGTWSHKTPAKPPSDKDAAGNTITDPRSADLGDYKHFVGFYVVPASLAQGQNPAPGPVGKSSATTVRP